MCHIHAVYVPSLEYRARELGEPVLCSRWYEALPQKGTGGEHISRHYAQFRALPRDDARQRSPRKSSGSCPGG